jgi:two-component system, response regulator
MKAVSNLILLVEDDPAHAEIVRRNLSESRQVIKLKHISDGQAALNYLFRREEFSSPALSPRPGLILLDLRLPKVDGLEVLRAIKSDDSLSRIPVVMLTTSAAETDVSKAYAFHANSYLVKPADFVKFGELIEAVGSYWLLLNQHPA